MKRLYLCLAVIMSSVLMYSVTGTVPMLQSDTNVIEDIRESVHTVSENTVAPKLFGSDLDWTSLVIAVFALIVAIATLFYQRKVDINTKRVRAESILPIISRFLLYQYAYFISRYAAVLKKDTTEREDTYFFENLKIYPEDLQLNLGADYVHLQIEINFTLRRHNHLLDKYMSEMKDGNTDVMYNGILRNMGYSCSKIINSLIASDPKINSNEASKLINKTLLRSVELFRRNLAKYVDEKYDKSWKESTSESASWYNDLFDRSITDYCPVLKDCSEDFIVLAYYLYLHDFKYKLN